MAKAKVKRIATRRARDIDVTIYRIAEMQKQIDLVNAKVESAIMNLGAANKRIDALDGRVTLNVEGRLRRLERMPAETAAGANVPVRIMPVDELVEYVKLHYSDSALKKLIAALVYLA